MCHFFAEKAIDFTSPEVLAGYLATGVLAVVGLLITVLVLRKILYKPLRQVISERQREADESISAHEEREKELSGREAALLEQEKKQHEILAEQKEETLRQLKQEREKILADAQAQADARLAEADREIELKRAREGERLYRQAVELAVEAVGRLEDRPVKAEEQTALERTIRDSVNLPGEAGLEA